MLLLFFLPFINQIMGPSRPQRDGMSQILFLFYFLAEEKGFLEGDFFFYSFFIFTLCSRSEGSRSSELNQLETWSFHKPGRTLSKWGFAQRFPFDRTLFLVVKKKGKKSCEGKKIPLELQRFSHTLLNLPPTFVKELKGINRKEFLC